MHWILLLISTVLAQLNLTQYQNNTDNPLKMLVIYIPDYDDRRGNYGSCVRIGSTSADVVIDQAWNLRLLFNQTSRQTAESNAMTQVRNVTDTQNQQMTVINPTTMQLSRIEGSVMSVRMCYNGTYTGQLQLPSSFLLTISQYFGNGTDFTGQFAASYQNITDIPTTPSEEFLRYLRLVPQSSESSRPQLAGAIIGSAAGAMILTAIIGFCVRAKRRQDEVDRIGKSSIDTVQFGL